MNCIACGRGAGYNRAVVDERTGREVAGLCVDCERTTFGTHLDAVRSDDPARCSFCDAAVTHSLPKWLPDHREVDGDVHCYTYLAVDERTPRLCADHLDALAAAEASALRAPRPERRRPRPR